jgi:hypothetical protein
LETTEPGIQLAERLVRMLAIPPKAADDALHVAICAVHGTDILLTWNCTHIANAEKRASINATIRGAGYEPPVICTPDELLGISYEP